MILNTRQWNVTSNLNLIKCINIVAILHWQPTMEAHKLDDPLPVSILIGTSIITATGWLWHLYKKMNPSHFVVLFQEGEELSK